MDVIATQVQGTEPTVAPTDIRLAAPNLQHWYAVASSRAVGPDPVAVTLWHQNIVVYRDSQNRVHALENRCPHRQVNLSEGRVEGDELTCAYHGWQFGPDGACTHVPYLDTDQKLPTCKIQSYPVQERDGFIWIYPGSVDSLEGCPVEPLSLPEWDHLNYIATVSIIDVGCHFSFLIENLMDMYHGHLHQDLQAWTEPRLQALENTNSRVDAHYEAQSYYRINRIWSVSQLFIPALRRLHPEPLDVSYVYPHWVASLGEDFKICCLFCPVDAVHTRAFLIHFTSLQAFHRLHKLPVGFRRWIKNSLFGSAQAMLDGLVRQDVLMLEQEQRAYQANPQRRGPELNRALVSVQRLIRQQSQMAGQHSDKM